MNAERFRKRLRLSWGAVRPSPQDFVVSRPDSLDFRISPGGRSASARPPAKVPSMSSTGTLEAVEIDAVVEVVSPQTGTAASGTPAPDVIPPRPPWRDLVPNESADSYLSFYLPDELSALPVRGITLPANNKSDPNLETQTYGLFSTCSHVMRASIVARRCPYIFFLTRQPRWTSENRQFIDRAKPAIVSGGRDQ